MQLPRAVLKFKQGFGRLIRHRDDRGCVLLLDPRLVRRGYGKTFLRSLPTEAVRVMGEQQMVTAVGEFFTE
jgi:ATP-dependent DNA helicase DinG